MTIQSRALLLFLSCLLSSAMAQVPSASIIGRVEDPAGLPVPEAVVTARSLGPAFERSRKTAPDGSFRLPALQPGSYSLTVEAPSFARYELQRSDLGVRQTLDLVIRLKIGSRAEAVTVSAIEPTVEAVPGPAGYIIDRTQVGRLPLAERNFAELFTLGPGVVPRHLGGYVHDGITDVQPARGDVGLNPPVNGIRSTSNTFLLDGVLNTDGNVNAVAVNPPLESVQEFRLQTSGSSAEFGYSGGGVVNMVTRSGSEHLHGGLFEYLRNEKLDARNYFNSGDAPKAPLRRSQFGAQAGGRIPRAPRLFFFGAYEASRLRQGRTSASRVPDGALRGGDFRGAADIFDPRTLDPVTGKKQPFPGNRIPSDRIDTIARTFLDQFEPLPNRPGASNNYVDTNPDARTADRASGRIDSQVSSRSTVFARYSLNSERARQGHDFPILPSSEQIRAQQVAVGHTCAAAGGHVNELRLGFTRLRIFEVPRNAFTRDVIGGLGINGIDRDPENFGLPVFILGNYFLAADDPTLPLTQRDQLFQALDHLAATRGRHTFSAGAEYRRSQLNYQQRQNGRGRYTFTGAYTGDPFGDFLLGLPQLTERIVGEPQAYLRRLSYAFYLQDEFRAATGFTVTLGLRYDFDSPFTEKHNNLFNLDYSGLPAPPRLVRAGTGPYGQELVRADHNDFAPRVGLAWKPLALPKLVFRAAYGIFYSPEIATETYDLVRNGVRNEQNRAPDNRPLLTIRDGFPSGATSGFPTYFGLDPALRTPYVQQWNAAWQAGFGGFLFEAAYVGTKGTALGRFRTFNTPLHEVTGENLPPRPGDIQQLRPFPALGKLIQRQHISNSIYHSLQLRAEKRLSGSLRFQSSFTRAKSIDDADGLIPGLFSNFGAQDERNLRLERGLSFFDVRKRLTFHFVYDLPLGRGRRFLAAAPFWTSLLSNWSLSGMLLLQDGTPLNPVYFAFSPANSDTPNRPNVVPGQKVALPRSQRSPERFFNTGAFSAPAPFTFGNAGRNILPGPGNNLVHFALQRGIRLGESRGLELRGEFYNAVNHPNFGIPGPYPDFGPFFGRIFSVGEPRRIQIALKVNL